jgi:hypothetical protein
MSAIQQGLVNVTSTPAKVLTLDGWPGDIVLQTGLVAVTIGGSTVTASGATAGVTIPASSTLTIHNTGQNAGGLWAVSASATTLAYFMS